MSKNRKNRTEGSRSSRKVAEASFKSAFKKGICFNKGLFFSLLRKENALKKKKTGKKTGRTTYSLLSTCLGFGILYPS